ncbi:SUMO ligase siz1 [Xylographa bjoerkii]|nr:SUMO ligase siz1 [Xylographa bjoerkii]
MASPQSIDPQSIQAVIAKTKTLINTQLKTILRLESLPVSGAKAIMQERIINLINHHARSGNIADYNRLRDRVYDINQSSSNHYNHSTSSATPPSSNMPTHSTRPTHPFGKGLTPTSYAQVKPKFRDSPFYSITESLSSVLECKVREATRDQLETKINLRQDVVDRLVADSSQKVMIYCASEPISPFSQVDITFPHQIEIRVNLDEVKANLRGLKGKPGSTRPADITTLLRKRSGYENTLNVTYALTNKKFYIVVNLVKQHAPEALVAKLKAGRSISKDQIIREMITRSQDGDIVTTSSIMSLKCPLSTLRIDTPCRSTICTHNQCFDALSFLQLQEQAPTWTCPVCNKVVSFQALQVDQYVNEILKYTPRSVDQVTVEPDGRWYQVTQKENPNRTTGTRSSSEEDDDIVEIQEPRLAAIKDEALLTPSSMARTPPYSSREQSLSSAAPRSSSGKRSIGQVIDLTFSSDEEEQPPRGPKRQSTSNGASISHTSSVATTAHLLPGPNGFNFNLPRLAPAKPPEPLDYRFGDP